MDTEVKEFDLAEGSFVEKMPIWSRWLLFIPAAFIGSVIAVMLLGLLNMVSMAWVGMSADGWAYKVFQLVQDGLLGALFVLFGATVIPRGQFVTAIILLVLVVLISVMSFFGSSQGVFGAFLDSLLVVIGGGYAVYMVHKGENIYGN
jgi:peptidoglycan/LPS O-acetylase OafA/YrhL